MIKIPFLRLDRQYKEIKNKVVEAIDRVLSSGNVLQGVETKIFEENLSKIFNLKYCVSVK